jgi:hypothetical protein
VGGKLGQRPSSCGAQQGQAIGHQPDRAPGIEQHLAGHGVQRADLDRRGAGHVRGEVAGDAGRHLGGSVAVEGDHPDPVGGYPRPRRMPSRAIRVVVLPLLAEAMSWAGPSGSVAAARCSGSSAASRLSAAGAAVEGAIVIGR